jgi:excisionase family DNA binding protein
MNSTTTLEDLAGRDFATVSEVAEILRADPRTIRRRIRDGIIPATRAGDYRVPVSWLREQARVTS